jgi:hypothetical protein
LPPEIGLIRIVITEGRYADLMDSTTREVWELDRSVLVRTTSDAHAVCQERARAIRVRADFIQAPSAQVSGINYALFPDRIDSALDMSLQSAQREEVPEHLKQSQKEDW